tara:strand:- start:482 stop:2707 length:2226 start_codon:yes stop_codon:yes gene_type:complete
MKKEYTKKNNSSELREKAEKKLKPEVVPIEKLSEIEVRKLAHELQVHQIELAMQNNELRKSQRELEETRDKYSELYDYAPVGYFTINEKGIILEVNLTGASMLGVERKSLIKQLLSKFMVREDSDRYYLHLNHIFKTKEPATCELRMLRKDGTQLHALLESSTVQDSCENSRQCRTIISDITELKQLQEELTGSKLLLLSTLNSIQDGIYVIDKNLKILYFNHAMEKLYSHMMPLKGKFCFYAFHARSEPCKGCPTISAMKKDSIQMNEIPMKALKGITGWLELYSYPFKDSGGNIIGAIEYIRDITERKHTVLELKKNQQKIDAIVKSVGEGIISIGEDSFIRFVNQELCRIFGYATEELIGQDLKILMPEKYRQAHTERLKKYLNGALPKLIGKRIEIEGLDKSGKIFPIEIRIEETKGGSDERSFTASIKDITETKKAEKELNKYASGMEQLAEERSKQLIHADRMVTLGTLSAGVAHEINNPVGFVSNNLQIFEKLWHESIRAHLEKANHENEDKKLTFALNEMPKMLKSMKEGTTRIINIVRGLGRFSRIKKPASEPSNICEIIESAVKFCKLDLTIKHKVKIQLDLSNDIPNIEISKQEIEQVLINLITNSSHAMEDMADSKELILKISASHVSNNIVIEINDNGHGMDEKTLDNIFNPFFTTKETGKGTGLGLSICRGIIQQHQGDISATSTLGQGTTITIKLPLDPEIEERRDKNGKKMIGGMRDEDLTNPKS